MKKANASKLLLLAVVLGFFASCSEDETVEAANDPTTAPVLPPVNTFLIDTAAFSAGAASNGRLQQGEYTNSGHAYFSYVGWQTALTLYLAQPAVAFRNAFDQEARYNAEEDRWEWIYDVDVWGSTFQIDLYGEKVESNAQWEMYISQAGGYQDVLWFSGTSALDGSGGRWDVNTDPENPREALQIEWKKTDGKIPYVKYTSVDEQSDVYQNYIEYGTLTEGNFNVFYNIYSSDEDNLLKIEYNTETQQGRASDAKRFGSADWQCWNSDFQNVDCE